MNGDAIFQILMAIAGSTVLTQIIQTVAQRKKVHVDQASVLSKSALEQLESVRGELAQCKVEIDGYRSDIRTFRAAMNEHQRWDWQVLKRLQAQGIEMDPPPEIWI